MDFESPTRSLDGDARDFFSAQLDTEAGKKGYLEWRTRREDAKRSLLGE